MTAQENAVQDRRGDRAEHATPPGETPARRGGASFLYASGATPLAGYTIKRGVGAGGFGEVYYAVSDAGKEVALKLIRRNLDTEFRGMKQCLNFKHPNLLSLYDIREDESGDTWIVMEYMSGRSLEAELAAYPNGLPPGEALKWFRGIAAGVAYLHDHGIVHRDLKPGNIFCDEGIVKVGDYGLSKFISSSRRSGHTESIGTVHYMAPEVAHGRYGKELDIYALGAVLVELLTGRVPFEGESVGEVLMKHLTALPDLSKLAEPYRGVAARALEKDPARRWATAGEMVAALPPGAGSTGFSRMDPQRMPEGRTANNAQQPPIAELDAEILEDPPEREPIARAAREQLSRVRRAWRQADLPRWARFLIVAGALFALVVTSHVLIPLAVFLTFLYAGYRIVRYVYLAFFGPQPMSPAFSMRRSRVADSVSAGRSATPAFLVRPLVDRASELIGSLLVAVAVTAAMCVVMALIEAKNNAMLQVEQGAWLFLVSLAGAWIILITGKFWEGAAGEPMLRRFVLMTIGLGLGLAAYCLADLFMVRLPIDTQLATLPRHRLPAAFYIDGRPLAMAYMAAFAMLMALMRWWRQADPMRATRLSLVSLIVTVVVAHIVAGIWQFPEPWLMMIAACMSVSVQLASPWVPIHARLRPQRKKVI